MKREAFGGTECAYEIVDVVTTTVCRCQPNLTLTFSNLVINGHSLATAAWRPPRSVSIGVFDTGETARIDNSTDLTNVVATSEPRCDPDCQPGHRHHG